MIFVKFKNQNVVCALEFSGTTRKSYVQCTTYDILEISALIAGTIFVENIVFSKSETAYFPALFHKNILKE